MMLPLAEPRRNEFQHWSMPWSSSCLGGPQHHGNCMQWRFLSLIQVQLYRRREHPHGQTSKLKARWPDLRSPDGSGYYAYATNGRGSNVQTAHSANLAEWDIGDDALPELPPWALPHRTWAPDVGVLPGAAALAHAPTPATTVVVHVHWTSAGQVWAALLRRLRRSRNVSTTLCTWQRTVGSSRHSIGQQLLSHGSRKLVSPS